jgi:hypothetical protein
VQRLSGKSSLCSSRFFRFTKANSAFTAVLPHWNPDPQELAAAQDENSQSEAKKTVRRQQHDIGTSSARGGPRGNQQPPVWKPPSQAPFSDFSGESVMNTPDYSISATDMDLFAHDQSLGFIPEVGLPSERRNIRRPVSQRLPPHQLLPNTHASGPNALGRTTSASDSSFVSQLEHQTWDNPLDTNFNQLFSPVHHRALHAVHMHPPNLNLQEQVSPQGFPQALSPPMPMAVPAVPPPAFTHRQYDSSGGMGYPDRTPSMSGMGSYSGPSAAMLTPFPHPSSYMEDVPRVAIPDSTQGYGYFPIPTQATSIQGTLYPQPHQYSSWQSSGHEGTSQSYPYLPYQPAI